MAADFNQGQLETSGFPAGTTINRILAKVECSQLHPGKGGQIDTFLPGGD